MKTRFGSLASCTARSNSRPARETDTPRTRTCRERRSTTSSPDLEHVRRACGRPPQHGADPGHELGVELTRGDVVGAALEGPHALDRIGARSREHDHRDVAVPATPRFTLTQARAQLGLPRQHHVRARPLNDVERLRAPARLEHVEAVGAEISLQVPGLVRVGIGQEKGSTHGFPG